VALDTVGGWELPADSRRVHCGGTPTLPGGERGVNVMRQPHYPFPAWGDLFAPAGNPQRLAKLSGEGK
jgi:hypothetical protein